MIDEIKPQFYTVPEVSKILRIGRKQAYDKCASGDIPCVKIGGSIRIPRIQFEQKFMLVDIP